MYVSIFSKHLPSSIFCRHRLRTSFADIRFTALPAMTAARLALDEYSLDVALLPQCVHLVSVGPEDILIASAKIGMDLAGQQGVLGYVGSSRVVVEGQKQ